MFNTETQRHRGFEWLPAVLAAAAFAGALVAFGWLLARFWSDVGVWARRDLRSQAELAAGALREPLASQDFRALTSLHASLEAKGLILRVRSAQGGWVFHGGYKGATVEEYVPCGEYSVGVAISESQVYAPFYDALGGFFLAALVGVLGMFAVFFVLYRQRVRIRELASLEKFRREFIADVSHEIKTPLTGILGAVELLGEEKVEREGGGGERNVLLFMLKKESKRLNGLVQSILDLARLEREGEVLNLAETDLSALVKDVAEGLAPSALVAGVELVCKGLSAGARTVRCDAQLVEQAVSNLIANAIRHSGSKDIVVSLESVGREIRIVVEDHGIGIPPEHATRIFERFHRVDPARASETGGAGLGLAIARRIARLHGGDLVLFPAKPHGCRFVFSLTFR